MKTSRLNANDRADEVKDDVADLQPVVELVERRAANLAGLELGNVIHARLDSLIDDWRSRATRIPDLHYKGDGGVLLGRAGVGRWDRFTCLNSIRDVEATTALVLLDDATAPTGDAR